MLNKEDVWGNAVSEFFDYADAKEQALWAYLFEELIRLTPRSYKKQLYPIIQQIGENNYKKTIHQWLELVLFLEPKIAFYEDALQVEHSCTYLLEPPNEKLFGRLLRTLALVADTNSIELLYELALKTGKNQSGIGFVSYFLAETSIRTLFDIKETIPYLLKLQAELQSPKFRRFIETRLGKIAKKQQRSSIELVESYLPDYGFVNGYREGELSIANGTTYFYQMRVQENRVKFTWYNQEGNPIKGAPTILKKHAPQKVELLKQTAINAQKLLTLQRERLQKMWLEEQIFTFSHWEQNYAAHGLLGVVIENLIWQINTNQTWISVWSSFGRLIDRHKNPVKVEANTSIRLWHQLYADKEESVFWEHFIRQKSIKQPFEQVNRKIYRLESLEKSRDNEEIYHFRHQILNQKRLRAVAKSLNWNYKWISFPKNERSFLTFELPDNTELELWVHALPSEPQHVISDVVRLHKKGKTVSFQKLPSVVFSELLYMLEQILNAAQVT